MSNEKPQPDSDLKSRLASIRDRLKPALEKAQEKVESKEEIIEEVIGMMAGNLSLTWDRLKDSHIAEEGINSLKRDKVAKASAFGSEKAHKLSVIQGEEDADRAEVGKLVEEISLLPEADRRSAMEEINGANGVLAELDKKFRAKREAVELEYRLKEEEIRKSIAVADSLGNDRTLSDPNNVIDLVLRTHLYAREMQKLGGPDTDNVVDDKVNKSPIDQVASELGITEEELREIRKEVVHKVNYDSGLEKKARIIVDQKEIAATKKKYEENKSAIEKYLQECRTFQEEIQSEIRSILNDLETLYKTGVQSSDSYYRGMYGQEIRAILVLPDTSGMWPLKVDNREKKTEAKKKLIEKRDEIMNAYDVEDKVLDNRRRALEEKANKMDENVSIGNFAGLKPEKLDLSGMVYKMSQAKMPEAQALKKEIDAINAETTALRKRRLSMFNIMMGREEEGRNYKFSRQKLLELINATFGIE